MNYRQSLLRELGFVSEAKTGLSFWQPMNNITWDQGCIIGRERADQVLRFMREHEDPVLYTRIGAAMMGATPAGAVEVAFAHRMAEILIKS